LVISGLLFWAKARGSGKQRAKITLQAVVKSSQYRVAYFSSRDGHYVLSTSSLHQQVSRAQAISQHIFDGVFDSRGFVARINE